MLTRKLGWSFLTIGALAGCASRPVVRHTPIIAIRSAATQPVDPKADLAIDQIMPGVTLPAPATQPTEPPSLDAIQTYAQARAALVDNQRLKAIVLLQRAAALDPDSFEVQSDLAKCYLTTNSGTAANASCIAAFEKAAALKPDTLEVQYELGRQYLVHGDLAKGMQRLRMGQLTTAYRDSSDPELSVMTDFFMGRALNQGGYTAAAVKQYENLLTKLAQPGFTVHGQSDLAWLVRHPEIIYTELGELYEKRGQLPLAMTSYQQAERNDPQSVEISMRIVRMALSMGQFTEAENRAEKLVAENHAGAETLPLLKAVYQRIGDEGGVIRVLTRLHASRPTDRLLFYALLDELKNAGRGSEAEQQLVEASRRSNADPEYVRRLFALYQSRRETDACVRLLVESLATRPDSLREIGPLWAELLTPNTRGRAVLTMLEKMSVPAKQEASRLFWISRLAEQMSRDALARNTLLQAAALKPPFAPVYRWLVADYGSREDWNDRQKLTECRGLADTCEKQGDTALAAELRGRALLLTKDATGAAKEFRTAENLGSKSPDLLLAHAKAIERLGENELAEAKLWRLLSDWPQFEDAYAELFNLYIQRQSAAQAVSVIHKWIEAVPSSVDGRLLEATIFTERGLQSEAQSVYDALFREQPSNIEVIKAMEDFYRRKGAMETYVFKLEAERARDPENRQIVEALVSYFAEQHRKPDALRVLEATRSAAASDPDLLYSIAHLYELVEQKGTTEQLLQQVVQLNPRHAAANNDLGYTWADEGRNLDRAESLVRIAVEEEPDNQSYLDSMAWVEYKRGKFTEARTFLYRAIGPAARPDPVVLDHLGDTLYRLHEPNQAAAQWQRSLHRIDEADSPRDELKNLRGQLKQKLKQQEQGRPVDVAPVIEK